MTTGREIITFQLGHYSNFIGAHWWNIQESSFQYTGDQPSEINHDVLFREGQTSRHEVTFTPRLLLLDLKGSLKHLSENGELYDRPGDPAYNLVEWPSDNIELLEAPTENKSKFLENLENDTSKSSSGDASDAVADCALEEDVRVWSDFLRTRYHPRTVSVVNEYEHDSETIPFDMFNYGANLWKTDPYQDTFVDLIRQYAEECDNIQGFHMLLDGTNGFAGLGSGAIQHLRDEYQSKNVLAFPAIPAPLTDSTPMQDSVRAVNLALAYQSLAEHSSLFVPLSVSSTGWKRAAKPTIHPYLNYTEQLPFHSSAVLASALETLTMRYRLRADHSSLGDMVGSLSYLGRRAAAASLGLPFPIKDKTFLFDALEGLDGSLWQSLTPNCKLEDDHMWIQSVVLRGIPLSRLRSADAKPSRSADSYQGNNPAYYCKTREEMLRLFLAFNCYSTASHVTAVDAPLKIASPFPQIFAQSVGPFGAIDEVKRAENLNVESVPSVAGLHSCRGLGPMLETLYDDVKKVPFKRQHKFQDAGLEEDEFKDCLEHLMNLRECYLEDIN